MIDETQNPKRGEWGTLIKRAFDVVFSATVLLLGSPLFLLIALLILFTTGTNPLFHQKRVGRGGIVFSCYKFRTMCADAELILENLLKNDPESKQEWIATRKLKKDPRITAVGAFLRRTSLDELPQFVNVLIGNMSVVGPRPITEEEVNLYLRDHAPEILKVRPGITGLWQTSGRNHISFPQRLHMDQEYVRMRSFLLDLKLVFKTIPQMLLNKGAY